MITVKEESEMGGSPHESSLPSGFTRVALNSFSSRLYFGDEALDRLFQGFKPRQIIYLYGSERCLNLAEMLCVRAQLPISGGGMNSKVIFLDGGCGFDPSIITNFSRRNKLDRALILRNILLSRAFTCFQMTNFIECKLKEVLEDTGSKLVVISDFPSLYCDQDLEEDIGREQFCRALIGLTTIIKSKDAIALITRSGKATQRMKKLEALLKRRCSITANIVTQGSAEKIILERHPSTPTLQVNIPVAVNMGLESFLEAA